jgi:tetratricopeptide (TPR) repeat protein
MDRVDISMITRQPLTNESRVRPRRTRYGCLGGSLALVLLTSLAASAEDTVILSSASDPALRIKKTGQILDHTGTELKLRGSLGRDESIPAARIVEVQTAWTAAHTAARDNRAAGKLDEAVASFREAKREERRAFAVRQIMAELSGTYLELDRIDAAGDEWLAILVSDPTTQHFDVMPMAWKAAAVSGAAENRAAAWLTARDVPAARVLGASWLLAGRYRTQAIAALDELARDADPRVSALAQIQSWRTKLVSATPAETARWQEQLEAMPASVQAAGWYVLGDILARQQQPEQAALTYLKVPLLFGQQRAMAADALLAAGKQLEKMGQAKEASRLFRELAADYRHLPAGEEAARRLSAAP